MPLLQTRQEFQPSCPSGGTWYSCGAGVQFVGCCTSDPCNENGCSAGNIRPASFNSSAYGSFPDLECDSGQFYTCTGTDPPFLGCCRENACRAAGSKGCPQVSLTGAFLPDNAAKASAWLPTGGPSSTATASASATSSASSDSSSTSTAGIVGGIVGAVVVLLFVIGVLIWRRRNRSQKKKKAAAAAAAAAALREQNDNDNNAAPVAELAGMGTTQTQDKSGKPPRYSAITNNNNTTNNNNHAAYAFELDGYPRKPAPQTPSELGADEPTAELPGDEAVHELEGSTAAPSFATPRTQHSSWSSSSARGGGGSSEKGGNGSRPSSGQQPRGLAISNLHPQYHHRPSPRSSPRSPHFPGRREDGGGGGGGDDASSVSEGGVSSLPSTPRSAYGPGSGTGTYSEVSRLSPMFPPPIMEDERGEGGGGWRKGA